MNKKYRKYGLTQLIFDLIMIAFTGGLWLIWLIAKYLKAK